MPTLTESRLARTLTLCALYMAQGMPWGFVTITLLAYVSEQGATVEQTARIMSLATLPWSFKVVWGVVIDRFLFPSMGLRRPWVLGAQLGIGITLLSMILIEDLSGEISTFAWMVFVHNCFVSLQDVASDALAVDVLDDQERGRVNGLMWASNYAGAAVGGLGMGKVLANFGLQAAFVLQVSVLLAIVCFPLFLRERKGDRFLPFSKAPAGVEGGTASLVRRASLGDLVRRLLRAFRTRGPLIGLAFALVSNLFVGVLVAVNPVYFTQELGWSQEQYSTLSGGWGQAAGITGAVVGGFLVDRIGMRAIYTTAALGASGLCVGLAVSPELRASEDYCTFYLLTAEFLVSAQSVASFSLFMRLCSVAVAGTQYTLFMAVLNQGRVAGAEILAQLGERGYAVIFGFMAAAMVASLPILFAIPFGAAQGPQRRHRGSGLEVELNRVRERRPEIAGAVLRIAIPRLHPRARSGTRVGSIGHEHARVDEHR